MFAVQWSLVCALLACVPCLYCIFVHVRRTVPFTFTHFEGSLAPHTSSWEYGNVCWTPARQKPIRQTKMFWYLWFSFQRRNTRNWAAASTSQPRLRRKVEISSHYDGCWPGLAWCRGESTLALRTEDKIGRRVKVTLFKPRLENWHKFPPWLLQPVPSLASPRPHLTVDSRFKTLSSSPLSQLSIVVKYYELSSIHLPSVGEDSYNQRLTQFIESMLNTRVWYLSPVYSPSAQHRTTEMSASAAVAQCVMIRVPQFWHRYFRKVAFHLQFFCRVQYLLVLAVAFCICYSKAKGKLSWFKIEELYCHPTAATAQCAMIILLTRSGRSRTQNLQRR